jgi:transcription termination factor Rho
MDILTGTAGQDVDPSSTASTREPVSEVPALEGPAPDEPVTDEPVTDEPAPEDSSAARARRRGGAGLSSMVISELQELAAGLGITVTARMRKNDLVTAIRAKQSGADPVGADYVGAGHVGAGPAGADRADDADRAAGDRGGVGDVGQGVLEVPVEPAAEAQPAAQVQPAGVERNRRVASRPVGSPAVAEQAEQAVLPEPVTVTGSTEPASTAADQPGQQAAPAQQAAPTQAGPGQQAGTEPQGGPEQAGQDPGGQDRGGQSRGGQDRSGQERDRGGQDRSGQERDRGGPDRSGQDRSGQNRGGQSRGQRSSADGEQPRAAAEGQRDRGSQRGDSGQQRDGQQRDGQQRDGQQRDRDGGPDRDDDDGRNRRGRRFRERRGRSSRDRFAGDAEPVISEDDVLVPVAGILDILDNYAFIRTSGYLPGPNDVYVSLSQVRKNGLRRGDAITGAVRQPKEGERRDKFNALVRLDTVNGTEPEPAKNRPEFTKLTPLYPQDRLRLETEPNILTTRVIDLVMPLGKGQRALIVSPPKAGKTMVLQAIANAITRNNPECHLMVVLVDERPEEVTDMQRSVKGEVIASTFDRPPSDHTTVAELSIERAKRLVELGHDVVVLLDSITRLGRAYNNASPASGRILSGGIDSTALYPPKRFLGAARNIENGGSLTILATALVETGSTGDTVIFEEFKGTGNAELRLDRKIADKRVFPAVDILQSSTRKEEILLAPEEMAIMVKLRRVLHALDSQQALDLLLDKLKETRTNVEFLMQVQKTTITQD